MLGLIHRAEFRVDSQCEHAQPNEAQAAAQSKKTEAPPLGEPFHLGHQDQRAHLDRLRPSSGVGW